VARQLEVKSSHVMSCHPHPPRLAPAGAREWVCTYPLQLPQESHLALAQVSRVLGEFSIQEKGNFYTTISYVSVSCRCSWQERRIGRRTTRKTAKSQCARFLDAIPRRAARTDNRGGSGEGRETHVQHSSRTVRTAHAHARIAIRARVVPLRVPSQWALNHKP
jgi:hypothetical protein